MTIYDKLLLVQAEMGSIKKTTSNTFFKNRYADINDILEVVKPVLCNHGLVLTQPIEFDFEKGAIISSIVTDTETSESIRSSLLLTLLPDPQKLGSSITYYRRYTLQSLLALQAEDDDGNAVSQPHSNQQNINYNPHNQGQAQWRT